MGSGKANTNLKVLLSSGKDVVLRFYDRDASACAKEAALATRLWGTVPIARPIWSDPGSAVSLWEWVPGEVLEDCPERIPDVASDLGRVLATIGETRFDRAGFLDGDLAISYAFDDACGAYVGRMRECLGTELARTRIGSELAGRTDRFIEERQALLDPYRGFRSLVHSDYKASNLLVEGSRLAAVLDWEFAHSGSPLLDISILLRHRHEWSERAMGDFARGFRDGGGYLDARWLEASSYLDLVSLLDFLVRPGLGPRAATDIADLIARTVS